MVPIKTDSKQLYSNQINWILFLLILFIVLDLNKFNLYLDPKGEFVYILLIELKNKPS